MTKLDIATSYIRAEFPSPDTPAQAASILGYLTDCARHAAASDNADAMSLALCNVAAYALYAAEHLDNIAGGHTDNHIIDDKLCARLRESTTTSMYSQTDLKPTSLVIYAITLALMIDRTPNDQ